jgi:hypothetical protein
MKVASWRIDGEGVEAAKRKYRTFQRRINCGRKRRILLQKVKLVCWVFDEVRTGRRKGEQPKYVLGGESDVLNSW